MSANHSNMLWLIMYQVDTYIKNGAVGIRVNSNKTLAILALGFALGYCYYKVQQNVPR